MPASIAWVRLAMLAGLWLLAPACSSGDDDDSTGGTGGSGASGGSGGGASGTGTGGSGAQGPAVDCAKLIAHAATLCAGRSDIDANWLDIAERQCEARAELTPDTARLEETCVNGAADCNAAVNCVASPH